MNLIVADIRCSVGSISRPISVKDHNATNQAIAMDIKATSENLIFYFVENNKVP